jgi:hypothetical protein
MFFRQQQQQQHYECSAKKTLYVALLCFLSMLHNLGFLYSFTIFIDISCAVSTNVAKLFVSVFLDFSTRKLNTRAHSKKKTSRESRNSLELFFFFFASRRTLGYRGNRKDSMKKSS